MSPQDEEKYMLKTAFTKRYKRLKAMMIGIKKNQREIINSINTLTAFKTTTLDEVDGQNEDVKQRDENALTSSTTKKRRRHSSSKDGSLEDIKGFFHGRGYEIKDDGKKPIKVLDKDGVKKFVIQRNKSIYKCNPETKEYTRVTLEDLV